MTALEDAFELIFEVLGFFDGDGGPSLVGAAVLLGVPLAIMVLCACAAGQPVTLALPAPGVFGVLLSGL